MKKEHIFCAAIHYDDGKSYPHQPKGIKTGIVVSGRRHHNVIVTTHILSDGKLKTCDQVQGFLTSTDRFVDRFEAAEIALKAEQIKKAIPYLTSEDVW